MNMLTINMNNILSTTLGFSAIVGLTTYLFGRMDCSDEARVYFLKGMFTGALLSQIGFAYGYLSN